MQGTLARAREENNSSLIWVLVGSPRQGLFLHWISATVLLPVPDTDLPWLPCRVGLPGAGRVAWLLGFLVLPVHPWNSLRQLPSAPDHPCGNPVLRAWELSLCPLDLAQKPPPPGRLS